MKITEESFKADYWAADGSGPHSAYIDASYGDEYLLGTNQHSDTVVMLKYFGYELREAYCADN